MTSINVHDYVNDLFKGYEDTGLLQDFKEEITTNLLDRIRDLQKGGLDEQKAFTKAVAELGDITSVADQISRQKRNEIIGQMYFQRGPKMSMKHAIGYTLSGGIGLFGILVAFITYFSHEQLFEAISSLLPFLVASCVGFVFLGLTLETSTSYPMSWKRAAIYAVAAGAMLIGIQLSLMMYFLEERSLHAVFGTLIPFVLPGICLFTFLLLTEKSRHKPWVTELHKQHWEHQMKPYHDPRRSQQRGLLSGALWVFTIALFLLLGFATSFMYAWIVFLFAIAVEILIEFWMQSRK